MVASLYRHSDDGLLDLARLTRELQHEIHARIAAQQIGEAFVGLERQSDERRTAQAA